MNSIGQKLPPFCTHIPALNTIFEMSILGVLYKVQDFSTISSTTKATESTLELSLSGDGTLIMSPLEKTTGEGHVGLVAVPVGLNVGHLSPLNETITLNERKFDPSGAVKRCCSVKCISFIDSSHIQALQANYHSIKFKGEQKKFLTSLIRSKHGDDDTELSGPKNKRKKTLVFQIPQEGNHQPRIVCKDAFKVIYNLSSSTINVLSRDIIKSVTKVSMQQQGSNQAIKASTSKSADCSEPIQYCDNCGRSFVSTYSLGNHQAKGCKNRLPAKECQIPGCPLRFHHTTRLAAHMREFHSAEIEPERHLKFASSADFISWKRAEEASTFSFFTQASGMRILPNSRVITYACQKDGKDRSHARKGQPERKTERRRSTGRIKSNITCVAHMKAEVSSTGEVYVQYSPTHSHPLRIEDTLNHPLSPKAKAAIEELLGKGLVAREILQKLRARNAEPNPNKGYVEVEGQLVHSRVISALARGKHQGRQHLHANDRTSVYLLAEKLKTQHPSPLLLFKPQDQVCTAGPFEFEHFPKNAFIFALQQENQAKILQQQLASNRNTVLYIASLEDTNNWGLTLYTILIADELYGGFPVAFCLTNQKDSQMLATFLSALEERSPQLWVSVAAVVATPEVTTLLRGMVERFPLMPQVLMSVRHVLHDMQSQLQMFLSESALQQELSQSLLKMITATTETHFQLEVDVFKALCAQKEEALNYCRSFELKYMQNPCEWAMCRRDLSRGPMMNSVGYSESFHNILMEHHKMKHPLKRVDDLLNSLVTVVQDNYLERSHHAWIQEVTHRQMCYTGEPSGDLLVVLTCLPKEWFVVSKTTQESVVVTALAVFDPSTFPGPRDLFCTCPDPLPFCQHILSVLTVLKMEAEEFPPVPEPAHFCELSQGSSNMSVESPIVIEVEANERNNNEDFFQDFGNTVANNSAPVSFEDLSSTLPDCEDMIVYYEITVDSYQN